MTLDEVSFEPASAEALRIVSQPQARTVIQGGIASFNVQAESPLPLSYQWDHSTTNGSSARLVAIAGATNASLVIAPVMRSEALPYGVVVTNELAGVMSELALLTVSPTLDWAETVYVERPFVLSPDGESFLHPGYLGTNSSFTVWVTSARTGQCRATLNLNIPTTEYSYRSLPLAVSPDNKTLAVGTINGDVQLCRLLDGMKLGVLVNDIYPISGLVFSPTGTLLAAVDTNAIVRVWRVADRVLSGVYSWPNRPGPVAALAFSPDDQWLAGDCGHHVVVWNLAARTGLEPAPDWDPQGWIGYSPDGMLLASLYSDPQHGRLAGALSI